MACFDFYENPGAAGFLLDVQADLMRALNTRIVVPLLPEREAPRPAARLNPLFVFGRARHVMVTQYMAAVPTTELRTLIGSLAHARDEIRDALDMIFRGF